MHFRTVALRFLPAPLLLLTACPESNTKTETVSKTAPAAEETMASTAAAMDSTKPATPSATPRPNRLTAPDTAYAQDVASFLGGQRPSQHSDLAKLAAQPAWQAFATDQDKSW